MVATSAGKSAAGKTDQVVGEDVPNSTGAEASPVAVEDVSSGKGNGIKGQLGFDQVDSDKQIKGKDLREAAKAAAPNLTDEVIKGHGLSDEYLADIASGNQPAPPAVGPVHTVDQYLTPGGFVSVPVGVDPARTQDGKRHSPTEHVQ